IGPTRRCGADQRLARHAHGCHRGRARERGSALMLLHLLYALRIQISVLTVVHSITFRTAAPSLTALALSLLLGPWFIRRLRQFQIGQVVRTDGPATHKPTAGTPTMRE